MAAAEAVGHPGRPEQDGGGGLETGPAPKRQRLDSGGRPGRAGSLLDCVVPSSMAPGFSKALSGQGSERAAHGEVLRLRRVLLAKVNLSDSRALCLSGWRSKLNLPCMMRDMHDLSYAHMGVAVATSSALWCGVRA